MTSMIGNQGMRGAAGNASGLTNTGGNIIPKGYKQGQLQQYTPEQMNLFKQLFSQVGPGSYLSRLAGGEEGIFQQLEAPAMKQFQELQSQLGSQFSQLAPGAMSAQRGSGFKNALNQATSDFAQQLQSQRMGLQQQAFADLLGLSQGLLEQRPYSRFLIEPEQKKPSSWIGASLPFAGAAAGGALGFMGGGPAGALTGAKLGGALGSAGSKAFF